MLFGKFPRFVQQTANIDTGCLCSKAANGTTESAIMNELRDMKNNFRG